MFQKIINGYIFYFLGQLFGGQLFELFARETNLKKQGMLPLTFSDPSDYDRINEDARLSVRNLESLAPGQPVIVEVNQNGEEPFSFETKHTFSEEQIEWFKAGSALNVIRSKTAN